MCRVPDQPPPASAAAASAAAKEPAPRGGRLLRTDFPKSYEQRGGGGGEGKLAAVPVLTRAQVRERSDPETCCLIILGRHVYDCTDFQELHPGGRLPLQAMCGRDGTDPFMSNHPRWVVTRSLRRHLYAELGDPTEEDEDGSGRGLTASYRRLTREMELMGIFDRDYGFYYWQTLWLAGLFAAVLGGVFLSDSIWVHALAGMTLGLFWQQVAFMGHDIGHNGVTQDRITDSRLGLFFGNFCSGIGIGWWKRGHNVHHVVPNSIEQDPDIQHLPVFAVDSTYLERRVFSTYYGADMALNSVAHVLVRYQQYLYYPVMAFARFNLYAQSIMHVCGVGAYSRSEVLYRRDLQKLTLAGFWTWLVALTLCLPTWPERVLFFVLAHNVAGILHIQITLSHFGMPAFAGDDFYRDYDDDTSNGFLLSQLRSSMDIDCPPWMDWFHGGLQFQTVHHVWPGIPRRNLRRARPLLESFCGEHNLKYVHEGFLAANGRTLAKLREASESTKSFSELFSESWNLDG
jgi:delta8-fatty-acid desaturase